jgi:tetratricopeptide (TPR) repeat protein
MCPPEQSGSLLDHAAWCRDCADRLRDLVNAVSGEREPLDATGEAAVESLSGRLDRNRQALARSMSKAGRPSSRRRHWMMSVAAGLVVAAAAGWFLTEHLQGRPPLELLAAAYTSRRTMELRIPGAAYGPLQVSRGGAELADLPSALLESQLEIKRHLESQPESPVWLHAQGRAYLLLWQYDAALASFQAASDLGAEAPDFLIDYASAYYQRAERTSSAIDYARALEKLSQVLNRRPDDAAALFNRGIVHTKLHQYGSAIDDFEHCLRLQSDPQWKAETERWLREARSLAAGLFDRRHPGLNRSRAEHDLEEAMVFDLAAFFGGTASHARQTAAEMLEQHRDPWLSEMLSLGPTIETVRAVEGLSRLADLRVSVNPDYARAADTIPSVSAASLPLPLRVWHDYEILYRDTRSSAVAGCAGRTRQLIAESGRYPWMQAQVLLESSLCSAAAQDFVGAGLLVDRAEGLIREHKFELSSIRIPNFRGQRLVETGYFREALQVASDALARFDAGSFPPRRAYDFHAIVMLVAGQLNLPYTGYSAARMMGDIGRYNGLPLFEMVGRCREAGLALSLGLTADAGAALKSAEATLARLGDNPTARIYWRTSRVAWLESQKDTQSLYRMLDEAHQDDPANRENLYFYRKLVAALCRLEARAGRRARVEEMAAAFWQNAGGGGNGVQPGMLRAFRPELESVSQSLTSARLQAGDNIGALGAWGRFLEFDTELLGAHPIDAIPAAEAGGPGVLTVADLGEKVAVWLESGGRVRFHWASQSAPELEREVRRLRRLCSIGAAPSQISSAAQRLYRSLLPGGPGGASQVWIRSSGVMNTLPLAVFSMLGEARDTVFSFLPFGRQTANSTVTPANAVRMTVVAATSFEPRPGLAALPETEIDQEIAGVRRAFDHAVIVRGTGATARAMEEAAAKSEALHFSGHATPWRGMIGLLMAPDASDPSADGRAGVWSMGRPRSVSAGLVVLSACGTGAFDDPASVESGQLAASMLLAGARQVVASLWDVDSTATTAWNRAFYEYLAEGLLPGDATKLAGELLRRTTQWRSPKYWAGFALYQR